MTWRVIWVHGTPWPEHHDFRYEEAAIHFAGILREIGRENVTIHQLPDATRETP